MIGLDTNVLLRSFLGDDPEQSPAARRLIVEAHKRGELLLVTDVVLAEYAWVLGRTYKYDREKIALALELALTSAEIETANQSAVAEAIALMRSKGADFADALIAITNRAWGCSSTWTFDRRAGSLPGFTLVDAG